MFKLRKGVPRRIHKDEYVCRKLDHLDPTSLWGKYDWILKGNHYYPQEKTDD